MNDTQFVDYYELLQISPNADSDTIQRVHRMMMTRFHPDNPETGNLDKFLEIEQAYKVLVNPETRAEYDKLHKQHSAAPMKIFEMEDFAIGVEGEANRRIGILCLLYKRRRSNPDDAGLSILEFESMMSCPREHLMFTMWYLREHEYVRQDEASDYVITGKGVDYVEANLPTNEVVIRLLEAGAGYREDAPQPSAAGEQS